MKNLIKKSIAAVILLTAFTISALADGDVPCPPPPPPPPPPCGNMQCPAPFVFNESPSGAINDKDQESDDLSSFIIKMFEKIGFLF